LSGWLEHLQEDGWLDCPVGVTAAEHRRPLRTRMQRVASGHAGQQVFVIDSDERRAAEQGLREKAMAQTRQRLEKLQQRVAKGKLKQPAAIGAAATRALRRQHGGRYYRRDVREGGAFL
jgi:hypothetical protein